MKLKFDIRQLSYVLGGRKFIVEMIATYLLFVGKLESRWWFWVSVVYIFGNIVDSFAPNINKSIPDIIKIIKAELHVPDKSDQPIDQPKI
jgi:hypothetical protein